MLILQNSEHDKECIRQEFHFSWQIMTNIRYEEGIHKFVKYCHVRCLSSSGRSFELWPWSVILHVSQVCVSYFN